MTLIQYEAMTLVWNGSKQIHLMQGNKELNVWTLDVGGRKKATRREAMKHARVLAKELGWEGYLIAP